jgi:hypothetical protein
VANAAVTPQVHEPLYIHGHFTAKVTFNRILRHLRPQVLELRFGQVFDVGVYFDAGICANA